MNDPLAEHNAKRAMLGDVAGEEPGDYGAQQLAAAGGLPHGALGPSIPSQGLNDRVTHEVLSDFEFVWEFLLEKFPESTVTPLAGLLPLAGQLVAAMAISRTRG